MTDTNTSDRYHDRPYVTGTVGDGLRTDGGTATQEVRDTYDEATIRDRVWDAVLELAEDRPIGFRLWRVRERAGLDESKDRTIRRTLNAMAELGWLSHFEGHKRWHLGEKLQGDPYRIECLECGAVEFGDPGDDVEWDKAYHRERCDPDAEFEVTYDE